MCLICFPCMPFWSSHECHGYSPRPYKHSTHACVTRQNSRFTCHSTLRRVGTFQPMNGCHVSSCRLALPIIPRAAWPDACRLACSVRHQPVSDSLLQLVDNSLESGAESLGNSLHAWFAGAWRRTLGQQPPRMVRWSVAQNPWATASTHGSLERGA